MSDARLDQALRDALAVGDPAGIARAYRDAADSAEEAGDGDRAAFLLTHAWIFALEAGDPLADDLRARLVAQGRERSE